MGHVNLGERLEKTRVRLARQQDGAAEPVAKFAQLTRKETRVREDQYAQLTNLARSLMRRRVSRRERITENTLIRVAIDLLLAHQGELRGSDEVELRRSVASGVPDFRSLKAADSQSLEGARSRSGGVAVSRTADVRDIGCAEASESRTRGDSHSGDAAVPASGWGTKS
ncbi:hypothetical protein QF046_001717 [Microbacterium sp. W4I4]|uniref:hypothetical protein n=1 Tax=Microbacterium sp. W4I4 TaxID=3042295 RepID=UPI002787C67B|nr:hypothetical protein [Microbacterium sp. W4I4]MDQ0614076.1 hypothetical protein [Microbacterium sp. W4I4]